MRTRAQSLTVGLAAVVLLLAAGCGGSSSKAPAPLKSAPVKSAPSMATGAERVDAVPAKPSAGCQSPSVRKGPPPMPSDTKQTLAAAGASGWYFQHLPPTYRDTTPMPLLLDLHGYGESAELHTKISGLGAYGDSHGFLTVTPQTAGPVPLWDTNLHSKDVAWLGALLDNAERVLCVDTNRVFVTGYSNGAFMTSALACTYADRFAAVAPVAGIRDPDGCQPSRAVPVIAFHGTADHFVTYDGSIGSAVANLPAPDGSGRTLGEIGSAGSKGPSIPEILAAWAARNKCLKQPEEHLVASDVTRISYPCPRGDVELYRVTGGGHAWPGSPVDKAIEKVVGPVTMSINADALMWSFFTDHPLR
jgi:polyhydroxybutyrate depolymerase